MTLFKNMPTGLSDNPLHSLNHCGHCLSCGTIHHKCIFADTGHRTEQVRRCHDYLASFEASLSSGSSTLSTQAIRRLTEQLKCERNRDSTRHNYYIVWHLLALFTCN